MPFSPRPPRRFTPRKTGDATPLGELESAVMRVVWSRAQDLSVGDVHADLPGEMRSAYTTIKTTMERLSDKGILSRTRSGKAYLYRAAVTQEALERHIVTAALDHLVAQFPGAIASFFVRPDPGVSEERLALLDDAVARRREAEQEEERHG